MMCCEPSGNVKMEDNIL